MASVWTCLAIAGLLAGPGYYSWTSSFSCPARWQSLLVCLSCLCLLCSWLSCSYRAAQGCKALTGFVSVHLHLWSHFCEAHTVLMSTEDKDLIWEFFKINFYLLVTHRCMWTFHCIGRSTKGWRWEKTADTSFLTKIFTTANLKNLFGCTNSCKRGFGHGSNHRM